MHMVRGVWYASCVHAHGRTCSLHFEIVPVQVSGLKLRLGGGESGESIADR